MILKYEFKSDNNELKNYIQVKNIKDDTDLQYILQRDNEAEIEKEIVINLFQSINLAIYKDNLTRLIQKLKNPTEFDIGEPYTKNDLPNVIHKTTIEFYLKNPLQIRLIPDDYSMYHSTCTIQNENFKIKEIDLFFSKTHEAITIQFNNSYFNDIFNFELQLENINEVQATIKQLESYLC